MQDQKYKFFETLMSSTRIPACSIEYIGDILYGTPRYNYNRVMSDIRNYFTPVCGGGNCRYKIRLLYGMNIPPPALLHRQTHKICNVNNCGRAVSDYSHSVCYKHVDIYHPAEYDCHHSRCDYPGF